MVESEEMRISQLVSFLMYMGMFATSVRSFSSMYQSVMKAMGSLKKVFDMMALPAEELYDDEKVNLTLNGDIKFENVNFKYSNELPNVFENLNLDIKQGETVALIGPSGIGKTTLLNLIPAFYKHDSGTLSFTGQDIKDLDLNTIRSQIGIVPQDLQLFNGTIVDNLLFGNLNATKEQIYEACKNANAHKFITDMPNGYQTKVGESGVKLSYGQRQRIAIARVILKNPAILLLDEPTSALDLESELIVQDALKKLMKGRTTIIAGHHLNTLKFADRIAVIGEKRISEIGSHEELMKLNGYYTKIRTQMEAH